MDKCQCHSHGFCEFFQQEMTYDPPNWQWCQNASPHDRVKYKKQVDRKHKRHEYQGLTGKYITLSTLVETCRSKVIPKLYEMGISGIAGVPRSGCLIASVCATALNIPLYHLSKDGIFISSGVSDFGGYRMRNHIQSDGKIAVIDDTVFSGDSIKKTKKIVGPEMLYGCVYAKPENTDIVDFFGEELEGPHILDWHFFNSSFTKRTLFDFDGIFSPDVPPKLLSPEKDYINYLNNVKPIFHRLPKMHKIMGIVTGRLEKYRAITEDWLGLHGIRYERLTMFPTEYEKNRNKDHINEVGNFKSDIYKNSNAIFFMESSPYESKVIRRKTGKLVICPQEEFFG